MKKTVITIIILIVLGIVYWVISSNSIDKVGLEQPVAEGQNAVGENLLLTQLFEDIEVGSVLKFLNTQENVKTFDGIQFTLTAKPNPIVAGEETILTYNLMIDGRPASDMQTQDGVYGKGVAVHRESLELVPVDIVRRVTPHGTLEFRAIFPKIGEYKIFTQFKRGGEVITTDFDVSVL